MKDEKMIEEMARVINEMGERNAHYYDEYGQEHEAFADCNNIAEALYAAGYRKQSEWISVEDKLPNENDRVLVYVNSERSYTKFDTDRLSGGKWVRWYKDVSHWMPLPEAPKMKRNKGMNKEQIIKALSCCKTPKCSNCAECPARQMLTGTDCMEHLITNTLALINELTEQNRRLLCQVDCDQARIKLAEEHTATLAQIVDEQQKDVERLRAKGEWIFHIDDLFPSDSTQECSLCHAEENIRLSNENYCPNCGAKMKGGE